MSLDRESTVMTMNKQTTDYTTQVVNVSGTRFEMSENTWIGIKKDVPEVARGSIKQGSNGEVFLERHAGVFQSILYFHQGGELHLPVDVCPSSFKSELEFYGVDEACMAKCCFTKYVNYFDDQEILKILEDDESQRRADTASLLHMKSRRGWKSVKAYVWLVLDEPFHSRAAKVYFVLSAVIILVSLFALVAGTHPTFQRALNIEEWQEYFGDDWLKYKHHFLPQSEAETKSEPETSAGSESEPELSSEPEAESGPESEPEVTFEPETTTEVVPGPESEPEVTSEPETTAEPETGPESESEPTSKPESESEAEAEVNIEPEAGSEEEPVPMPENAFVRYTTLEYIEYICTALFSLDLLVRVIFCPFRSRLMTSFLNWVDVFSLSVMYARYVVEYIHPKEKYEASAMDILHCLQIVRVFRLFRLVKNFVGFRVLVYAFKASAKELMLMTMFLLIAMLIFATFAFFSGDSTFVSIPDSFWWAIVTMTTVGYGDVVPKEDLSKCIGIVCAVAGVCLIAVIIPIFVNNFMLFYSYSKVWGKKYDNDQQRKNRTNVTEVVSIAELARKDKRF